MPGSLDRRGGRGRDRPVHPYPRTARVNALLVEVVGVALERIGDEDERLGMLTVTAVKTDPDLRHATVFFASLTPEAAEVLLEHRASLQAAISRSARMKRTPLLQFLPDPAVAAGEKVEEALRRIRASDD
ncbi:MAG TPA: ribosome-binding factor A [Acidimicrobiales bacterium]|nr:ribosome-binding factor A [Acidimicrobiales bacterium]